MHDLSILRTQWIGLALGMLMLAGCTTGGGQASTPVEPAVPVVDVASAPTPAQAPTTTPAIAPKPTSPLTATDVVCERAVRCGLIGRSQLGECHEGPGRSRLTRVWGYGERFDRVGMVARGQLKLEHGDTQACLGFLASAPCLPEPTNFPKGCGYHGPEPVLIAATPPGKACERDEACIDGFCTAQPGCRGVCVASSPVGSPCGEDEICSSDDAYCWKGRCQPRAEIGVECGGHWQWCKDGLICDGYLPGIETRHNHTPERPGRCSAGKLLGESCVPPKTASHEVCIAPLYCDWGSDHAVCRERLAAGAECRWVDACADGLTCLGLTLGGRHPEGARYGGRKPGRCTPALDAGETCDPAASISGCPAAMTCDAKTRLCRSTGHAGDPCTSSWVTTPPTDDAPLHTNGCAGDNYCDRVTLTCKPTLAKGARCEPERSGVDDSPCFLGECDRKTRRCTPRCAKN